MSGELKSLLWRYEQGKERVDVAKLRIILQQASALDRWYILSAHKGPLLVQTMRFVTGEKAMTALHRAAHSNDVGTARYMIEDFKLDQISDVMNVRDYDEYENTPLHIAAYNGSMDMVKFILDSMQDRTVELFIQSKDGNTPLHAAVYGKKEEIIQLMLSTLTEDQRYEVLKVQNKQNETVLHTTASKGHTDIMKYTLESVPNKKADLLKRQAGGSFVLESLVSTDNMEMVQLILSSLAENQRYEVLKQAPVLHFASAKGRTKIVKYIIESAPNDTLHLLKLTYGTEDNTPLHAAAIEKKSETVLTILQSVTPEGLKELLNIKNKQNQTIADLAAPQLYHISVLRELAVLKESCEQKDTVIAAQAKELKSTRQEVTELRESYVQQETVITRQAEELRSARQEQNVLQETYVQQETVIARQTEELQQLRDNQTEMLRMIADLQISLGMCFSTADTSDQENETDSEYLMPVEC